MIAARISWIVCAVATCVDLLTRFGGDFDFARVMHIEAVLFPGSALTLAYLYRRQPSKLPRHRRISLALAWLFALGSLRPLLWTLGAPLVVANLAALVVAVCAAGWWLLRYRQ
jgi:hypothetical protein